MRHKIITHKKSIWYSSFIAIVLLLVILWMGKIVVHAFINYREVKDLRNTARTELQVLQEKNNDLEQKIQNLSTDYGLDQEIRTQYRVIQPGEQMLIIVDNQENNQEKSDQKNWLDHIRSFVGI